MIHLNLNAIFVFLRKCHLTCILILSKKEITIWNREQNMVKITTGCCSDLTISKVSMHANTDNLWILMVCYFDQILQVHNLVQCYADKCILLMWPYTFSYFQPILQLDLRWPLTLVHDPWCMIIWRFTYYINKPSLVQIRLQLFKWGHFHIFRLSYTLTSDDLWPWYDIWPHQYMRVPMCHLWPNFGWNPSKHVEDRAKC